MLNGDVIDAMRISYGEILAVTEIERRELERRERLYRDDRPYPALEDASVILVDDGLATGASMRAAIAALREKKPKRIVVAVPVGPDDTCAMLRHDADVVVCGTMPEPFGGVGAWYEDFAQVSDEEVRMLIGRRAALREAS